MLGLSVDTRSSSQRVPRATYSVSFRTAGCKSVQVLGLDEVQVGKRRRLPTGSGVSGVHNSDSFGCLMPPPMGCERIDLSHMSPARTRGACRRSGVAQGEHPGSDDRSGGCALGTGLLCHDARVSADTSPQWRAGRWLRDRADTWAAWRSSGDSLRHGRLTDAAAVVSTVARRDLLTRIRGRHRRPVSQYPRKLRSAHL
jgi:hypothetical protein